MQSTVWFCCFFPHFSLLISRFLHFHFSKFVWEKRWIENFSRIFRIETYFPNAWMNERMSSMIPLRWVNTHGASGVTTPNNCIEKKTYLFSGCGNSRHNQMMPQKNSEWHSIRSVFEYHFARVFFFCCTDFLLRAEVICLHVFSVRTSRFIILVHASNNSFCSRNPKANLFAYDDYANDTMRWVSGKLLSYFLIFVVLSPARFAR